MKQKAGEAEWTNVWGLLHDASVIGRVLVLTLLALPLVVFASHYTGSLDARLATRFLVRGSNQVVLRMYEDAAILATFDRETRLVQDDVVLLRMDQASDTGISFTIADVGPLKPTIPEFAIPEAPERWRSRGPFAPAVRDRQATEVVARLCLGPATSRISLGS